MKVIRYLAKVILYFCVTIALLFGWTHYSETRSIEFKFSVSCIELDGSSRFEAVDENGEPITMVLAFEDVGDQRFDAYQIDSSYSGSKRGYTSFRAKQFFQLEDAYVSLGRNYAGLTDPMTEQELEMFGTVHGEYMLDRKSLILRDDHLRVVGWPISYWQCSEISASQLQELINEAKALPGTEGNRI